MKTFKSVLLVGSALFVSLNLLHAQALLSGQAVQAGGAVTAAPQDSIVQVTAEAQGLQLVAPADLPDNGTYWLMTTNGQPLPLPFLPPGPDFPIYQMSDGIFLVDETGGQVATNENNSTIESALAAQADAVVSLINQVQDAQVAQLSSDLAMAFGLDAGMDLMMADSFSMASSYDPAGLWLEITNVANGWSYCNLHNGTNFVYAILSKTNLTDATWNVETELFPTGDQTNVMPFAVQNFDRQTLFLRALDWTGVTENGNTTPDWWLWQYFGTTALSDTNLDSQGNTLLSDYQNGTDPNVLQFSIEVTNNYVTSMNVPVSLNVFAGVPSYVAVSVDDPNYSADATWTDYVSSNLNVNLGMASGWHDVWIGLRGHADGTNAAAWQYERLKLNYTSPLLIITNPVMTAGVATVSVPLVQINGYSPSALANVTYDLSNAVGVVTGQSGGITDQTYDTNTWEFTTTSFEAVDVPLAVGLNVISLHATDTAGNTTTTNLNLTLDYSSRTNPPAVQLFWPKNGEQISGSSFNWRGWVDDPLAKVSAQIVGADGSTNTLNGLVERNGNFWVENLPMPNGTNSLTLTVTDSAGEIATTNITVSTCPFTVTMTPIPDDQLWNKKVTATGTISDSSQSLWINGMRAYVTNNVWTATNVPTTEGGTAIFNITCYSSGERLPDGTTNNATGN